jgi:RNA polymerase sigma factor (sigma-70 family)
VPAAPPLAALVRRLTPDPGTVPDAELLDRFIRSGDQAAFELLVWRYGGLVWGACRRVLAPDRHAAEDACQAAFVALAVRAGRVRDRGSLAAWLHRVAVRAALDLRAARRRTSPLPADSADPAPGPDRAAADREVGSLLDAGVNRLPERLRVAFVLCELEGRSNAEAAAALGCPVGTVESRLVRARRRLRGWLSTRGVAPAVGAAVGVPDSVRAAMVRAGTQGVGPAVRALADRAARSALGAKLRGVAAAGLVMVAAATGFGLSGNDAPTAAPSPDAGPPNAAAARNRTDAEGAPLPAGVIARFGSSRLRHTGWVYHVCFSPDGQRIASVGTDADGLALRVWDGDTGRQLFAVRRAEGGFDRVAFASGGKAIVVAGHEPGLACDLWRIDATTGEVVALVAPLPGRPTARPADPAVSFSPDGSRLAVGSQDGKRLHVFDALTGAALWTAGLGDDAPGGTAFAYDGGTVAVSTAGDKVRLYDAAGKPGAVLSEAGVTGLTVVAFSPDGARVLANGNGGLVAWDRASGKSLWKRQPRAGNALAFTPDGKSAICSDSGFASCAVDPTDGLHGGVEGKLRPYFRSMVGATCSAVRPDGKAVAFGTPSGAVCLYDPVTGSPITPTADPPHEVRWMRFSPDGKTLYGWAADWFAWDVATGKQRRVTNAGWDYGEPLSADGKWTARSVWYSGRRPRGSTDDGIRLEIRDAATGEVKHSHPDNGFQNDWKDFTPDGKAVVGTGFDGILRVIAVDTGKELARLPGHRAASQYHAFSADGRILVTGAFDDAEEFPVRVYDLKAGKELAKFHPGVRVGNVAVSADGRRVAAVTVPNSRGRPDPREVTVVWDVATGKELARVPQFRESSAVALSPDGRLVAVGQAWYGEVRVWEVASHAERFLFRHAGPVTGLAFAPDGRALAAASKEAPVYLWDVTGNLAGAPPAWDPADADRVWADLASPDAAKAFAGIRRLRGNPTAAVPFLRERTKPPATPDPDALKMLFADLDAADFGTREKATAALAGHGESVGDVLRAELARSASPEARKRLQGLLDRLSAVTPDRLRLVRTAEAVEGMGTPAAGALLTAWAGGAGGSVLAAEATAALARRPK